MEVQKWREKTMRQPLKKLDQKKCPEQDRAKEEKVRARDPLKIEHVSLYKSAHEDILVILDTWCSINGQSSSSETI